MRNKYILVPFDLYEQAKDKYDSLLNSNQIQQDPLATNNITANIDQIVQSDNTPQSGDPPSIDSTSGVEKLLTEDSTNTPQIRDTVSADPTPGIERLPSKNSDVNTDNQPLTVESAASKHTKVDQSKTGTPRKRKSKTKKQNKEEDIQLPEEDTNKGYGRWIFL